MRSSGSADLVRRTGSGNDTRFQRWCWRRWQQGKDDDGLHHLDRGYDQLETKLLLQSGYNPKIHQFIKASTNGAWSWHASLHLTLWDSVAQSHQSPSRFLALSLCYYRRHRWSKSRPSRCPPLDWKQPRLSKQIPG